MTNVITAVDADVALKAKHRAMWRLGDYPAVATEVMASLGPVIVEAAGIGPGHRVLDVAAGSGNAAIPAAMAGASVVATDLTPALLESGRREAARRSLELEWHEGDAEALPFPDAAFDAVLSCVGVMFAPHHQAAADELVRVCRAGGSITLLSWTPEGFIGQMFATMRPFGPPAPAGTQPAPLWGREAHVRALLGDRVADVRTTRRTLRVDRFRRPEDFREYFKRRYGPTISVYRYIAHDVLAVDALDRDLDELARRFGLDGIAATMEWEYLLLTARRA